MNSILAPESIAPPALRANRPEARGYVLAIAATVLATVIRHLLDPLFGDQFPLLTYYFAVVATAWFAGLRPTLLATVLSIALAAFLFMSPRGALAVAQPMNTLGLVVFAFLGTATGVMSSRARAAALYRVEIAERERAEAAIREGRERLEAALDASGTGTFRWDIVTNRLDWDENLDRLFGLPPGRSARSLDQFVALVHPDDRSEVLTNCARCRDEGADFVQDFRIVTPTGELRWLADRGRTYRDASGRPAYMTGACVDITARKRDEARWRLLAEEMPQLVWATRPDGYCDYLNEHWSEFTGVPVEALVGDGWIACLHPDDRERTRDAWRDAVAGRCAYDIEYRVRRHDGAYRWFKARGVPLRDDDDAIVQWFGTSTDIEDIKRFESELRSVNERLSESDRRKDIFLTILGHELRNPLGAIRNSVYALRFAEGDPAVVADCRALIERQVGQMIHMVDDLLDVGRIARGKVALKRTPTALADILGHAVESSRPAIDAAGHTFTVRVDTPEARVDGDAVRLAQVFSNLLTNAAKYTPPGGTIELALTVDGAEAVVSVRDSGVGIDPSKLQRIFDLFAQVDEARELSQGGLGIGLTLVKRLTEMHGGRVEARSAGLGSGSEFVVRLPLAA